MAPEVGWLQSKHRGTDFGSGSLQFLGTLFDARLYSVNVHHPVNKLRTWGLLFNAMSRSNGFSTFQSLPILYVQERPQG